MDIQTVHIEEAGEFAHLYNTQVVPREPFAFPVSADEFAKEAILRGDVGADYAQVSDQRIFVARERGKAIAFCHATLGCIPGTSTDAMIHFLTYEPGQRNIGQSVLTACEDHLFANGARSIGAYFGYCYRFYNFGTPQLSELQGHVYALLGINGYRQEPPCGCSVFMATQLADPITPPPPPCGEPRIGISEKPGGSRPGLIVRVMRNEQKVAICEIESGGLFCQSESAQDCCFVDSVGVTDSYRGNGWGKYVLSTGMSEMRRHGYRTSVVSTSHDNYRAMLLYAGAGFSFCYRAMTLIKHR